MWLTLIAADILQPTVFVSQDPGNATISALGTSPQPNKLLSDRSIAWLQSLPLALGSLPAREGF
jgi:hypothetical protein